MVKVKRYKLTYSSEEPVNLVDAQPGIYFGEKAAIECFNLICDELNMRTDKPFEVRLTEIDEWDSEVKLLRNYSCE